jgi:hypothetical protein
MFQSLRQNSQVFVLHKGNDLIVETGFVTGVSIPRPKYPMVKYNVMQPQEMVVDIEVKLGNSTVKYSNLDAAADIAESSSNGESIVISTSKEAMNSELTNLKQRSIEVINSVDFHKKLIDEYDKVIKQLNPEYAEKEQQKNEINSLKEQMAQMSQNITALMQANTTLIEKLSKKEN